MSRHTRPLTVSLGAALVASTLSACGGDKQTADTDGADIVVCPVFTLDAENVSLSAPELGTSYEQSFTVTNDCTEGEALELKLVLSGDDEITIKPRKMTLEVGESDTVTVTSYAEATGTYSGSIAMTSNDPENPEAVVTVSVDAGVDADGDGFGYEADCDDGDASVNPSAVEVDDGIDQDCDGVKDEDFVSAGDLIVTEVFIEPTVIDDFDGEWIELLNLSDRTLDLEGWALTGADGNEVLIDQSFEIAPGGYAVLGPNADDTVNGGVEVDLAYSYGGFWLLKGSDDITIFASDVEVFSLQWDSSWQIASDASLALDPDHIDPAEWADGKFWCAGSTEYGDSGLLGTPGRANDDCTTLDEDGDGYTPDDGDCDDSDPDVNPRETDYWDGIDNDCNGAVDDITTDDLDDGVWEASAYYAWLGMGGTAIADYDGDGSADVAVGAPYTTNYKGVVYILSNDQIWDGGAITDADTTITGSTNYGYFGNVAPVAGDQTADGQVDLLVGGRDYYYYNGVAIALFEGGSDLTGSLTTGSDAVWSADSIGTNYAGRVEGALDVNGDGYDDVLAAWADADYSAVGNDCGIVRYYDGSSLSGNIDLDDSDAFVTGAHRVELFGAGLGGADFDGDGYDDVLVGAAGNDDGTVTDGGAWYIVPGSIDMVDDDDPSAIALAIIAHDGTQEYFGGPARPVVADLDGDGKDEVALGGYQTDTVYVFSNDGSLSGSLTTADAVATITEDVGFGFGMAGGDLNDDGTEDLLIGSVGTMSYWYITSIFSYLSDEGEVFWFDGATVGAGGALEDTDASASIAGASASGIFGSSLATGDLDGDGKDEFSATAPRTGAYNGTLYVIPAP